MSRSNRGGEEQTNGTQDMGRGEGLCWECGVGESKQSEGRGRGGEGRAVDERKALMRSGMM